MFTDNSDLNQFKEQTLILILNSTTISCQGSIRINYSCAVNQVCEFDTMIQASELMFQEIVCESHDKLNSVFSYYKNPN